MKRYLVAAIFAAASSYALADQPRALVMDMIGESEPEISAFDELNDGASIKLVGEAEISLTFYPTCEDVTVRGGTLRIDNDKLALAGGKIISRVKGECPGYVKLSPSDIINASIVTRSVKPKPWISPDPAAVLAIGEGTGTYDYFAVYSADGMILETTMENHKAIWPAGTPSLEAGKLYLFVLTGPEQQMHQARVLIDEKAPRVIVLRQK